MASIFINNKDKTYEIGPLLGKGSFSKVFLVTEMIKDDLVGQSYACKTLNKRKIQKRKKIHVVRREIFIHRQIEHKNIVKYIECFEDEANVYIILENCSNLSLEVLMRKRHHLTMPEIRYYLLQIINGISYLHSKKIIHRDIKLGNLLLTKNLQIKIADFGLAFKKKQDETLIQVCGTPSYIAPEVLNKDGYSYPADVWSLGCTIFQLAVGETPFYNADIQIMFQNIKKGNIKMLALVSGDFKDLIFKFLNMDPKNRITLQEIPKHNFLTCGVIPLSLPRDSVDYEPVFPEELSC